MPDRPDPLEAELSELGRSLDVPAAGDVAAAVRARLDVPGTAGRRGSHWTGRAAAVLLTVLALIAAVVGVSPRVRAELVDLLRIGAVQVTPGPAPTATRTPWPPAGLPGLRSASLAEARRSAAFPVQVPGGALGEPDEVLLEPGPRPASVALRYRPGPGRPAAGPSGVAVHVDEIAGDSTRLFQKYLDGAGARFVDVGGVPGLWIDGPHELMVLDRTGTVRFEPPRLAARTLIWQRGGVTLRLEADLSLPDALAVAVGMR